MSTAKAGRIAIDRRLTGATSSVAEDGPSYLGAGRIALLFAGMDCRSVSDSGGLAQNGSPSPALTLRPVVVAWLLAVGVDLFFNAGLFAGLFNQTREPSLLADAVLFRRIPVAYLALAAAVVALAWLVDRTDRRGALAGATLGGMAGLVVASMGILTLWTAIDVTGLFVAAGVLAQVGQFAAAGAVLGAFRAGGNPRRLTRRVLLLALLAAFVGIVIQNLMRGEG